MKKLLSLMAVGAFSISTVSATVSCMPQKPASSKRNPLKIGLDIDKTKAIDTSVDPTTHKGFTNYFIIGDSLSDVDGLTTYVKDKFVVSTGLDKMLDFNIELSGGYGFDDENGVHHNAFSNGPTTAYNIGNKLNFKNLKSSNKFSKLNGENDVYGKNYSIGGATAAKIDPLAGGVLLNDVSIEEQSRVMISQQKISSNDLVFFEIGGNDLFSMIGSQQAGDDKAVIDYMNDSIEKLRNSLFTLLNNGVENVFFMGPPIMDNIPRYAQSSQEEKQKIIDLGKEYELKIEKVVKEVKTYYGDKLIYSPLYEGDYSFPVLQKGYGEHLLETETISNEDEYVSNVAFSGNPEISIEMDKNKIEMPLNEIEEKLELKEVKEYLKENNPKKVQVNIKMPNALETNGYENNEQRDKLMEKYFFTDFVHPTKKVHEYVSTIMLEEMLKGFK
ncbi:SGNH/GDSL hydrolase family protein [Spiroplasma endosymbiont of Diplazon laetatorius]|uniref:SGNH/GDSL hydrolase family protein n=1 Tax=Spiroplasma endosymbiont of Diplazon laetatorius TaxID=3066322 RepID=UPI0030D332A0